MSDGIAGAMREPRCCPQRGLVILLTGHTTGIGKALWDRLAGGARGRDGVEVAGVVGLARSARPEHSTERLVHVCGDVASQGDCQRAVATAVAQFGRLDVLVNNAALCGPTPLTSAPRNWVETISVNLVGTYFCTQAALPHLLRSDCGGTVINLLSAEAFNGTPGLSAYSVSKAGLVALTRSLARELASTSMRVFGYAPGHVRTRMNPHAGRESTAAADDLLKLLIRRDVPSGSLFGPGAHRLGRSPGDELLCDGDDAAFEPCSATDARTTVPMP